MATYVELFNLAGDAGLLNKVTVACVLAAETIRAEDSGTPNHANRLVWAKAVFADPRREGSRMLWAVLAQNSSATQAQILAASDATIQSAVGNAVNVFATGS